MDNFSDNELRNRTRQSLMVNSDLIRRAKHMMSIASGEKLARDGYCIPCSVPSGRIVLHAFHTSECLNCAQDVQSASSDTDALCEKCAKELGACRRCGADRKEIDGKISKLTPCK